jgi:hypothetical protein
MFGMLKHSIRIERRFCGPPASANGGIACGHVAAEILGPAEVTLRSPPPLDEWLELADEGEGKLTLKHGETLIAEGRAARVELALPSPVTPQLARAATAGFLGWKHHPYPTCFVCGPARPQADGLGLFPGPVAERGLVAAPWTPLASLCDAQGRAHPHFVWAALDCPSWFGHASFVEPVPPILLGRLAVQIERLPRAGEACVVLGWSLGVEGRRIQCAAALHDAHGNYLAWSRATWITLRA